MAFMAVIMGFKAIILHTFGVEVGVLIHTAQQEHGVTVDPGKLNISTLARARALGFFVIRFGRLFRVQINPRP